MSKKLNNARVDIGFIVAMKEEADVIASILGLTRKPLNTTSYNKYTNKDGSIVMLTPGNDKNFTFNGHPLSRVGKVSAGVITTILVKEYNPRIIINCGTAGGIGSKIKVGDIIVGSYVTNHDMRFPFPSYTKWARRKIPLKNIGKLKFIQIPYKTGTITSAESFLSSPEEWKIIDKNGAIAKDMEAAGIAQALEILSYTSPYYVIKSVTDVATNDTDAETSSNAFVNNFTITTENLSKFIKAIVDNKEKLLWKKS